MKEFVVNLYGENFNVHLLKETYSYNNSLAVILEEDTGEEFGVITVCLEGFIPDTNCAYIDTNNCPWAIVFLEANNIAEPTGRVGFSGYCCYPEYKFNLNLFTREEK